MLLRFSKSRKRTVSVGFVKKSADSDSVSDSRGRHYKLIYTGHRAQHLSTGGRQMRRRCTSQAAQTQRNHMPCARQQCRGHNYLGRSPERPGHIGQPAAIGCLGAVQHCTVWSAPRPLNNVLPPSTPDVKRSNAMHVTSGRRHSLNLSGDMASVKRHTHTHARGRPAMRPPAAHQAAAHRRRTLHHAKTTRHPPQPAAPLPRRLPPLPLQIIIWSCEVMRV